MPSLEIFDALDAPDIIEIDGGLEVNVSETILGPEVIEVLQGPPGPPGPQGPGTVESVNGYTGPNVTLTAADVAALSINAAIDGGTY